MVKSTSKDAQDLFRSIHSAYSATPTNLKVRQSPLLNFPSLFVHPSSSLWNLFFFFFFFADHRLVCCIRRLHCFDSGGVYGFGGIISI
ncbi:unnamed protein product [Brassica oleracea var. botrytis]